MEPQDKMPSASDGTIYIQTLTGKLIELDNLDLTNSIFHVKSAINAKKGIPEDQ